MVDFSFPPAVRQPAITPYTLQGKDALAFLIEFNRVVDLDFDGNLDLKALKLTVTDENPEVTGANSLVLPIIQTLIPDRRIGRPEDLQMTLNNGDTLAIRNHHCIDLGVVLDFAGRNHEMALDFYNQLPSEARRGFLERGFPASVIGYGLKKFDKGDYKLGLVYGPDTALRPSEMFTRELGNFRDENVSLGTGLPTKLSGGNRTFYPAYQQQPFIRTLGLSRLMLDLGLNLSSSSQYLADPYSGGQVVIF